ncbi:MAG: homocysteine S-methyltransferase family protein [Nanoarchaeota archaeon]|nr:homocysteine S-methyltransferase family protein [Nanoarchaeota archaeon]
MGVIIMDFLTALKNKILVVNGAMGTFFQGKFPDSMHIYELNLKMPELVNSVQKQYIEAGADIVEALTFAASRYKLDMFGLGDKTIEINRAAVRIARKLANEYDKDIYVLAAISPLGQYIEPLGNLAFGRAFELYKEHIGACKDADIIMLQTFNEVKDLKAAFFAAKEVTDKPIVVEITYEPNLRTATGTDPLTALNICQLLGVDVFGLNCGLRPDQVEPIVRQLVKKSKLPLIVEPNGGIPRLVDGDTVYETNPAEFAKYMKSFADLGVSMVGSCCGTTPEHTKEIWKLVDGMRPVKREVRTYTMLSSRTKTVELDRPVIIGERINPTNRKELSDQLKQGRYSIVKRDAIEQSMYADLLDINVGVPGTDEKEILKNAILQVQETVECPLVIDTTNHEALEIALRNANGKVLINSVNGKKDSLESVLPLAKKYGAAVIGLCLDENGVADTAEQKVALAKKIIEKATKIGIAIEDIMIDCVVSTVGAEQKNAVETLKAVVAIKKLGVSTVLGVSNISHRMPNRKLLNSAFLTMALQAGLDAAIINPMDRTMRDTFAASLVLLNKDKDCRNYIESQKKQNDQESIGPAKDGSAEKSEKNLKEKLFDAVYYGESDEIEVLVSRALDEYRPLELNEILLSALQKVGVEFKCDNIFLPQVLSSAAAMKKAFDMIKIELKKDDVRDKGKILFATVKNDVHDIGKNIVIALLETQGYEIIDLGANISEEAIVKAAKEHRPSLIGLSALMTTTMIEMPKVIKMLRKEGLNIPVMVGGAVVNEEYAESIGAHYSKDAMQAIEDVKKVLGKK